MRKGADRSVLVGLVLSAVFVCLAPASAAAAEPARPTRFASGSSTCPLPSRVESAVRRLIPRDRQSVLEGVRVELVDLGDRYRVRLLHNETPYEKEYGDAARDCQKRVRFASVFVVLTLMPPDLPLAEDEREGEAPADREPEHSDHTPSAPAKPGALEPRAPNDSGNEHDSGELRSNAGHGHEPNAERLARLELAAVFQYSPSWARAPRVDSFGGELGVALGRGLLTPTLSIGYMPKTHFDLAGVRADITRLPASAGVRVATSLASWEFATDLGALAVLERVTSSGFALPQHANTLELGLRLSGSITLLTGSRFAPFLGLHALVVPAPHDIVTLPAGAIGRTPYLWAGSTLGLALLI